VLIEGDRLAQLMVEHGDGVQPETVVTLHTLDEDFFEALSPCRWGPGASFSNPQRCDPSCKFEVLTFDVSVGGERKTKDGRLG